MTCAACERAIRHPLAGYYEANCLGCEARSVSQAPKHLREIFYRSLSDLERGPFIAAVNAEFERRQRMGAQ